MADRDHKVSGIVLMHRSMLHEKEQYVHGLNGWNHVWDVGVEVEAEVNAELLPQPVVIL